MNNKEFGDFGEQAATLFLQKSGYHILQTKYRCKLGEVDIIALHQGTLVFIEVKTRKTLHCGYPSEAVNYKKQQKIIRTAQCYLQKSNTEEQSCRFDVIEVLVTNHAPQFNHIIDAFCF